MTSDFPAEGMELTHLLVVRDAERSKAFYRDVLGAEVYREYGGTSVVLRFLGTWLLLVTGGGPTADKPDVTFAEPADPRTVSHEMTIQVPEVCHGTEVSWPVPPGRDPGPRPTRVRPSRPAG